MNDEAALLAAIFANPEEDTPRLAYADWLDENAGAVACDQAGYEPGEPHHLCARCQGCMLVPDGRHERAEFIRAQIQWERMTHGCSVVLGKPCVGAVPDWCLACRLKVRDLGLQRGWYMRWGPYPWVSVDESQEPALDAGYWEYRRGFVEMLQCSVADWNRHGDGILASQPVTKVCFTTRPIVAGGAYGQYWLPHDPLRKAFAVSQVHAICRERGIDAGPDVTSSDLKALITSELRWPGVTFELSPTETTDEAA